MLREASKSPKLAFAARAFSSLLLSLAGSSIWLRQEPTSLRVFSAESVDAVAGLAAAGAAVVRMREKSTMARTKMRSWLAMSMIALHMSSVECLEGNLAYRCLRIQYQSRRYLESSEH